MLQVKVRHSTSMKFVSSISMHILRVSNQLGMFEAFSISFLIFLVLKYQTSDLVFIVMRGIVLLFLLVLIHVIPNGYLNLSMTQDFFLS